MVVEERAAESGGELRRQLGLGSACALVVGEVIGVGIFLTPAGMAKSLGSPFWLLVVWLVMGSMALAGALCFGALAALFPEAGGGYVYLRRAYGPRPAFLFGWMSLLVMDPGLTAALATGLAIYMGSLVALTSLGLKCVAVGAILAVAAVNIVGVRLSAGLLRGLTWLKLGMLLFLALWGFGLGRGDWSNFVPVFEQRAGSAALPLALVGAFLAAFFSFGGWWDLSKLAGEVRNPERTMPRAMVLGVVIVTVSYILTSALFIYLVPLSRVREDRGFAALAGEALFGRAGGRLFALCVVISVLGSLAGVIMAAPRVYFAMARDGLFFPALAVVHPRFGTPARAIALQAILAAALAVAGTFDQILGYFVVATVVFLALMVASVYILRDGSTAAPLARMPGYPVTPLFFLVPIVVLLVLLGMGNPIRALLGLLVVALGLPVYHLAFRRKGPVLRELPATPVRESMSTELDHE
jgi:basic amino acid/polyamine antiporter, APA family